MSAATPTERDQSFAETALRLGGKTDEEARRLGAVDKAPAKVLAYEAFYRGIMGMGVAYWDVEAN